MSCNISLSTLGTKISSKWFQAGETGVNEFLSFRVSGFIVNLLSYVELEGFEPFPAPIFETVDRWLQDKYPPKNQEGPIVEKVMDTLRKILEYIPAQSLVQFLSSLSGGLCLWIEDESEALPEDSYNNSVSYEDSDSSQK